MIFLHFEGIFLIISRFKNLPGLDLQLNSSLIFISLNPDKLLRELADISKILNTLPDNCFKVVIRLLLHFKL